MTTHLGTISRPASARVFLTLLGIAGLLAVALGLAITGQAEADHQLPLGLNTALRAGWAVRTGNNLYDAHSGNHFRGPPLAAIGLVPLGQPPAGEQHADAVPPVFALMIWYLFSVVLLLGSVHGLANTLDSSSKTGSWPWWRLRLIPLTMLAGPAYLLLAYSHADALLLALLTAMLCLLLQQRVGIAGFLLGAALAFYIVPVYLVMLNIIRRDRLMTLGAIAGLGICLMLIPGTVFGLQRTSLLNEQYLSDAGQLLLQHLEPAMVGIVILLTGITCWAHGWPRNKSPQRMLHLFGALLSVMVLGWKAGEGHRYVLLLPAVMGLVAVLLAQRKRITWLGLIAVGFSLNLSAWLNADELWSQVGTLLLWGMHTILLAHATAHVSLARKVDELHEETAVLPRAA